MNSGLGASGFHDSGSVPFIESSSRMASMLDSLPSIDHSLSEENGMNGLIQTARQLQILHDSANEERDLRLSGDSSPLRCFHGAASWSIELPICAIPMMLLSASLKRCLSMESIALETFSLTNAIFSWCDS